MARPTETGLNPVRKTLADGTVRVYYYDRKTGRSLGTDRDRALAQIAETKTVDQLEHGTIAALVRDYRASPAWGKLAPLTKES
jgi:hypothetical protein